MTRVSYPAIVEEREPEHNLAHERFNRLLYFGFEVFEHLRKMRPDDLGHQRVMFSVWALYLKLVQEREDVIRSGVCAWLGREILEDLYFVTLPDKLSHDKLEGDVSAVRRGDC